MPLMAFKPNPGIMREGTAYSNQGGWFDGNKIRFRMGYPEKIGGWIKATTSAFLGTCRALFSWVDLSSIPHTGVGTNLKYYVVTGGSPVDVTPIRRTVTLGNNPFATQNLSATVTVTDLAHGAIPNDFVFFSGAVGFNNISSGTINSEFQIVSVIDSNTYTVTMTQANATSSGGGNAVVASYQINTGANDVILSPGYGAGGYGGSNVSSGNTGYGQASTMDVQTGGIRLWSQTNFGQDLLFAPRYGAVYLWDATAPANAALPITGLPNASDVPTQVTEILVSYQTRQCIAFGATPLGGGAFDPMLVRWTDNETTENWTPDITNNAGFLELSFGSQIVTQSQTHTEIVVFTDTALYSMQLVSPPVVFGFFLISPNISIIGPNSKINVRDTVYWMGINNFYVYDGHVSVIPCTVRDYVFSNMNLNETQKVYCGSNTAFNEIWWFYPSTAGVEVDSYVVYNYQDQLWYYGTLTRTAWLDMGLLTYPIAASTDGFLYSHEVGNDDGSTMPVNPIVAYIQSSPFELDQVTAGHHFMFCNRIIPDVTFRTSVQNQQPSLTMFLKPEDYPGANTNSTGSGTAAWSTFQPIEQYTNQLWVRLRGRSMIFRLESDGVGVAWRAGVQRFDVRPDGRR